MTEKPPSQSIHGILAGFREDARNNRDLGDRFERLILRYLELDPIQADRFSQVWMWNDWPGKGNVGDVGIDLVAQERATGEFCAIQCKFYLPENSVSKGSIDSFLAASGREPFTSRMLVSTTDRWGKNAEDAFRQTKNALRISIQDLDASPIDWSRFDTKHPERLTRRATQPNKPHQQKAIADVVNGLAKADRGKLIMACGTGKTRTSLRLAEALAPGGHVLFLVPSLSLLAQALREWSAEAAEPLHCLAVCSDVSIGTRRTKGGDDSADITIHDLAFPATTSARQLVEQYEASHARASAKRGTAKKPGRGMTVVFSTYHSIEAVSKAQATGLPDFDLIICDEAHRTTGVTLSGHDESHFVKVHDAKFLKGRKRLYMTATPRIYRYSDWGETRVVDSSFAKLGSLGSNIGNFIRYTGRERAIMATVGDDWYFYRARMYRPDAGRFGQRSRVAQQLAHAHSTSGNWRWRLGAGPHLNAYSGMASTASTDLGCDVSSDSDNWTNSVEGQFPYDAGCWNRCMLNSPPAVEAGVTECKSVLIANYESECERQWIAEQKKKLPALPAVFGINMPTLPTATLFVPESVKTECKQKAKAMEGEYTVACRTMGCQLCCEVTASTIMPPPPPEQPDDGPGSPGQGPTPPGAGGGAPPTGPVDLPPVVGGGHGGWTY